MKNRYAFSLLVFSMLSPVLSAQTMLQNWLTQSNNAAITNSDDRPYYTHVDGNGIIGIVGVSNSKVILATYDANGNDLWTNKYSSYSSDYPLGIEKNSNGNYYIGYFWGGTIRKVGVNGGNSWTTASSSYHGDAFALDANGDVYVVGTDYAQTTLYIDKIISGGAKIWTKTYTGFYGFGGRATHLKLDHAGNLLIALNSKNSSGDTYLSAVKFDTVGANLSPVWQQAYTTTKGQVYDFMVDNIANSSYVTGYIDNGSNYDMVVAKFGPSGALNWSNTFNDPVTNGGDQGYSLAQDVSGNIFVALSSQGSSNRYTVRKYSNAGSFITGTSVSYTGFPGYYTAPRLMIHPANHQLYLSCTDELSPGTNEMALYKTSLALPSLTKVYNFNGSGVAYSTDIDVEPVGQGLIFSGDVYTGINGNDYTYSKLDTTGAFIFNNSYNGVINGTDYGNSIAVDASNNALVAGATQSTLTGLDGFMVKYDAAGNEQWQSVFTGAGGFNDCLNVVDINSSGHYYAGGFTEMNSGNPDMWIIKVDGNGSKLWDITLQGSQSGAKDEVRDIFTDNFNNGYAVGYQTNAGTGQDAVILKFNSSGSLLWNKKYTGAGSMKDGFFDVGSKTGNPLYAVGYTTKPNGESDMLIVKYDASGNLQWSRTFNSAQNGNDTAIAVNVDTYNNIAVVGRSDSAKVITVRYDANGNLLWSATEPAMDEVGPDVAAFPSGRTVIVCHKDSGLVYKNRVFCYNSNGTLAWYKDYNYSCCEHAMKIAKTSRNTILVALDYYGQIGAIELDTLGNEKNNVLTYLAVSGNAEFGGTRDIHIDGNGDVYVAGYFAQETGSDIYTQKLCYTPAPTTITGAASICAQSQGNIYSVTSNTAITNYAWAATNGLNLTPGTNSVSLTAGSSSGYLLLQQTNYCGTSPADSLYINVNPLPSVNAGSDQLICPNSSVTLNATGAQNYSWNNGVVNGLPFTPVVTQVYVVDGTDANGCSSKDTVAIILKQPPVVSLCMATVDTFSTHNILTWEKTGLGSDIDYFNIYREDITNNYTLIGSVSFDSLSQYHDYDSTNANPNVTTKRYKIAAVDTCGNEGPKSFFHNTIFISNSNGTFTWNTYTIQNAPNPVNNYALYRDNLSNGNWVLVGTTAGTQNVLSDPQYSTYQSTGSWRVETIWGITCTPTFRQSQGSVLSTVVKSKSNITNNKVSGIQNLFISEADLYPNPTNGVLNITYVGGGTLQVKVISMIGAEVYNEAFSGSTSYKIDLDQIESGTYLVQIKSEKGTIIKRVVKN